MVELERFPLAEFPTPVEPLERLTDVAGGPRLWMKRDDLTGLGLGGNSLLLGSGAVFFLFGLARLVRGR
jgi:1-aminocyclopropane-1-carboxylate deaminase/D-cysteine desulfhydrase-like pyridoxal-dependent ACC family enzyme